MDLWCQIAGGSNMKAQREGHGVLATVGSSSGVVPEDQDDVSDDPNDIDFSVESPPQETKASDNKPDAYELSDSDNEDF
jgi:hypothetical protein